ncbi:MAG: DMT family transporter [Deltaproteobacteria bacterium]|nr:DMT family transporter [Deltaproteobacteria bacterium]
MADLALILVMAIWGSSFSVLRFFLSGDGAGAVSPLAMSGARMTISSVILLVVLLATQSGRASLRSLFGPGSFAPQSLLRDGLAAGALLAFGFVLQIEGLARTTASRSGFLTGLLVVFTPVLEFAFFRKRPAALTTLGLALAFVGMAMLSGPIGAGGANTLFGDLLTVGCAVVFAGHIIVLGRATARHPVLPLLWLQLASVSVVSTLVGPFVEEQHLPRDPRLWAAIVYLALFATLLAFGVQTWAQRRVTPVRLAILSSLEPAFAAAWAAVLLGERLSSRELIGGALILLGVIIGELGGLFVKRSVTGPDGAG